MADNQPKPESESERLAKLGIPVEEGEDTPPKEPEEPKAPEVPKESKPEEKKPEVAPEPPAPPKEEPKVPPVEAKKPEGEEPPVPPKRPEKYIPIPQYLDEKKAWGEKEKDYQKRISELEAIKSAEEGSKKSDEAIKAYAEKYNVSEDSVRELATIFGGKGEDKPAVPPAEAPKEPELSVEQKAALDEANQIRAEKAYDDEFTSVAVPDLTKRFPKATPEQLAEAKKELEVLATTREYLDKPLDFIIFKEAEALGKVFAEAPTPRGVESAHRAPNKNTELTADDFKNSSDFSELKDLSSTELDKLVKSFDNATWGRYKKWVSANDELVLSSN